MTGQDAFSGGSAEDKWSALFVGLDEAKRNTDFDELAVARVTALLASVRLVQPFDWMAWRAPHPTDAQIERLSLADCVRHITRIVRAERFGEGSVASAVGSGYLLALCRTAHRLSGGDVVSPLAELN